MTAPDPLVESLREDPSPIEALSVPGWEDVADFALSWCNEHTGRGVLSTA